MLTTDQMEAAVFDLVGRDQSVNRIIAFSGDRTDTGEGLLCSSTYLLPLTSRPAPLSIASGLYY
jgi:hypothetical protein